MLNQEPTPCQRPVEPGCACTQHETMPGMLRIRPATTADLGAIGPLRQLSARILTGGHYAEVDIDGALASGSLDSEMIEAGSFFVATIGEQLVGTAAWSPSESIDGAAVVRSVYVHPKVAGTGVGQKLMHVVECHAAHAGCERFELQSSLSAVGFYLRLGYHDVEQCQCTLNNGVELPVVQMYKRVG